MYTMYLYMIYVQCTRETINAHTCPSQKGQKIKRVRRRIVTQKINGLFIVKRPLWSITWRGGQSETRTMDIINFGP